MGKQLGSEGAHLCPGSVEEPGTDVGNLDAPSVGAEVPVKLCTVWWLVTDGASTPTHSLPVASAASTLLVEPVLASTSASLKNSAIGSGIMVGCLGGGVTNIRWAINQSIGRSKTVGAQAARASAHFDATHVRVVGWAKT